MINVCEKFNYDCSCPDPKVFISYDVRRCVYTCYCHSCGRTAEGRDPTDVMNRWVDMIIMERQDV